MMQYLVFWYDTETTYFIDYRLQGLYAISFLNSHFLPPWRIKLLVAGVDKSSSQWEEAVHISRQVFMKSLCNADGFQKFVN